MKVLPMKIVPLTVLLAVLAVPASGQGINLMSDFKRPLTNEEIEKQKAVDEAYKSQMSKIPDAQKSNDPWGNVRGPTPAPAGGAKAHSTSAAKASKSQPAAK